jgi:hypothetical protein
MYKVYLLSSTDISEVQAIPHRCVTYDMTKNRIDTIFVCRAVCYLRPSVGLCKVTTPLLFLIMYRLKNLRAYPSLLPLCMNASIFIKVETTF